MIPNNVRSARSDDRARIETDRLGQPAAPACVAPGQTTGRGLKQSTANATLASVLVAPGQTTGRGLKRLDAQSSPVTAGGSARSDDRARIETLEFGVLDQPLSG